MPTEKEGAAAVTASEIASEQTTVDVADAAEISAAEPVALPLAQRLVQQRQKLGYSIEFVANHLKLSARKIQQMEEGDWSVFPAGPFLSGFVRNYARLLELDAEAMVALLPSDMSARPAAAGEIFQGSTFRSATRFMPQSTHRSWWRWLAIAGVALVLLLVLLPQDTGQRLREWSAELNRVEEAAQKPVLTPVQAPVQVPVPVAAPEPTPAPAQAAMPAKVEKVVEASTAPSAAPAPQLKAETGTVSAGQVTVHFNFGADSWVEVTQKDGRSVFSQLNASGTEKTVAGVAPLSLVIGNASQTRLEYKGKVVDLKPFSSRDDVARITLE